MTAQLNIFGNVYDDSEPCFIDAGTHYFDRVTNGLFLKTALDAKATAESYTWGPNERGTPSAEWRKNHMGISYAPTPPPTPAPITATAAPGPGGASDPGTITIAGGPADKAYTVTATIDAGHGDVVAAQPVTIGQTAAQVAAALGPKIVDANVVVTVAGAVITVDPTAGHNLTKIEAVVT